MSSKRRQKRARKRNRVPRMAIGWAHGGPEHGAHPGPWLGGKNGKEETMVTTRPMARVRTWTCDCGFATVDEKVAVQHMQGHFRRKENYRVVITYQGDEGTTVEDVRGARRRRSPWTTVSPATSRLRSRNRRGGLTTARWSRFS
jgi:hypothetical protein